MTVLDNLIVHCRRWSKRVQKAIGAEALYIFGSIIHRGGTQFNPKQSDLDLIIVIPRKLRDAPSRTHWLIKLQVLKGKLEVSLISLLSRGDAAKPIVSLVPTTNFELRCDIHKSGVRTFFRDNIFLDLLRTIKPRPLRRGAKIRVDERKRQIIQFAQKVRNEFLSVSASGRQTLVAWDDPDDPIPKEIMRYAAIASEVRGYDTQQGLDNLWAYIYSQREFHKSYLQLHNWFSVRRGARGQREPLDPHNYVLLVEAILDMAHARRPQKRPSQRNQYKTYKRRRVGKVEQETTHINGYKLFYFRLNHNFTIAELSRKSGIKASLLRQFEKIKQRKGNLDPSVWFAMCERRVIHLLEDALEAHGRLETGKPDDFLTQYMMFYDKYKTSRSSRTCAASQLEAHFQTRAVVFDFDGTLTIQPNDLTTWEMIWVKLGYSKELCFELHQRYQRKEFNHRRWCELTLDAFKAANLRQEHMLEIASEISLVDGVSQTLQELYNRGLKLFILSGSIKSIIQMVLGGDYNKFEEVKANELIFDDYGKIAKIVGTPYDFEGKAVFIKRIIEDCGLSPSDILFVGNDCNDVFASQSGARTLCVNARLTDPANEEHWTYAIGEMANLHQILKFVNL